MDDNLTAIIIVLICVLGPIWLATRGRTTRYLNAADAEALQRMAAIAERMESRLAAVERVLEADSNNWRNNAQNAGGRYGGD